MSMAESTSDAHYHRVEKSSDEGCSNWRLLRRAVHQASVSDAARDALLRKSDRPWTPELVRRSKGEPPPLLRAMTANFVLRRTTYERAVAESGLTCQGLLVSVGPLQALTARALAIGLVCGVVSAAYKAVMDACLHFVWPTLGPLVMSALGLSPPFYILIAGTLLSTANGVALRVLGEPTNNLPEVVVQIHSDGQLDSSPREFLSMTIVSLFTICSGASFGPEAPLIAIGGGLASLAAERFALPKAEVLVLTLCGMGAGLAAFFGQPIGGALFACEVIHSHGLEYFEALIPAVSAAVACNFAFRVVSHLPGGGAVWAFPAEPALAASTALLGAPLGLIGGALGVGWMAAVTRLRGGLTTRGVMKHHVAKGAVAGLVIGTIGICLPETLFWAEAEAQTLIDGGQTQLEHAWPSAGVFGRNDYLTRPAVLVAICLGKLLAIGASVLGGHRGGFIFPFFFAGISLGLALAKWASHVAYVSPAACALCVAASLNVAVTKSWLSTPVVLCEVSGRVDVLPCLLVASVVALFVADGKAVIKAARPRSDNDAEHQLG